VGPRAGLDAVVGNRTAILPVIQSRLVTIQTEVIIIVEPCGWRVGLTTLPPSISRLSK
jgi:hypothetical protein